MIIAISVGHKIFEPPLPPYLFHSLLEPSTPPEGIEAIADSSSSIHLSWSPPLPENQNGIVVGYVITATQFETEEMIQWFSEMENITLRNLKPYTTYKLMVAAQTNAGTGPFSTPVIAVTQEDGNE